MKGLSRKRFLLKTLSTRSRLWFHKEIWSYFKLDRFDHILVQPKNSKSLEHFKTENIKIYFSKWSSLIKISKWKNLCIEKLPACEQTPRTSRISLHRFGIENGVVLLSKTYSFIGHKSMTYKSSYIVLAFHSYLLFIYLTNETSFIR